MWVGVPLILLALGSAQGRIRLDPLVDTNQGLIRGLRADDGDYSMFLGIPYAKVDMNNPFGASIPHPIFDEVFEAYDDSAVCPQVEEFENTIVGNLDCLHLNIYVPNKASSKNKLPVLVYIHGGAFSYGFSNRYLYGPKFLVQHDVILVTLNYRLGPYGFFCLDTPEVPGNQGFKDQTVALRWIKQNIASFGGDVNKITIMGESAGAASVELHLYSNQEKLFNQVIIQSGSVFSPWAFRDSDITYPLRIAERLGFQTDDVSEALTFLKDADTKLVIAATSELGLKYRPCVEKQFDGVDGFLTDHPLNLDIPKVKNVPVLSGFTDQEELFTYGYKPLSYFKDLNIFREILELAFNYDDEFQEMEDIVRHFYIGDEEISEDVKSNIIDYSSDINYNYPMEKSMNKLISNGAQDVYHYVFSYSGIRNFVKKRFNITDEGAAHADELAYLFDLSYDKVISEDDQKIIDQMTALWTNFVKYGEPTPETTELLPVKWVPLTQDTYHYLDIDRELSLKTRPFHDRLTFWELFYMVNEKKLKGYREN